MLKLSLSQIQIDLRSIGRASEHATVSCAAAARRHLQNGCKASVQGPAVVGGEACSTHHRLGAGQFLAHGNQGGDGVLGGLQAGDGGEEVCG